MSKSIAQSSQINCDPVFDPLVTQDVLATSFEGSIVFSGAFDTPMSLAFLNGQERSENSVLGYETKMGYYAKLSPDGRYLVNFPSSEQDILTVLEISTGEMVFISLDESESVALTEINAYPPANNPIFLGQRLEWVSSTEFVIRRLDLERMPVFLFEQSFMLTNTPLTVIRGKRTDFVLDQPQITDSSDVYNFYSPSGKYLVQRALMKSVNPLFGLIRVVDTLSQEILITLSPTGDSDFENYLWSNNEHNLFVSKRTFDPSLEITTSALYQIDFRVSPLQLTTQMWDEIEQSFGKPLTLKTNLLPITVSPSENKIAFKIRPMDVYTSYYIVTYDLVTKEIAAVCDNALPQTSYLQTFWSPDERYVGYFDDTRHVLVVMDTQESAIYSLPLTENDQQFLGWIP